MRTIKEFIWMIEVFLGVILMWIVMILNNIFWILDFQNAAYKLAVVHDKIYGNIIRIAVYKLHVRKDETIMGLRKMHFDEEVIEDITEAFEKYTE